MNDVEKLQYSLDKMINNKEYSDMIENFKQEWFASKDLSEEEYLFIHQILQ